MIPNPGLFPQLWINTNYKSIYEQEGHQHFMSTAYTRSPLNPRDADTSNSSLRPQL